MADSTPPSDAAAPRNAAVSSSAMPGSNAPERNAQVRNLLVALAAIALSVLIVLGIRTQGATATLSNLAQESVPLNVALSNGQPTLMEFYADWCTSCQAMAGEMAQLKQENPQVNFVMLNVDNTKWLPEVLKYRVDGIPHFVFINQQGQAIAEAIGEQPKVILAANLTALSQQQALPYVDASGQVTAFSAAVKTPEQAASNPTSPTDPRSHGAQVVK